MDKPLERYIVFTFSTYYPAGGWCDMDGIYNTEAEAVAVGKKRDDDYWEVVRVRADKDSIRFEEVAGNA